MTSKILAALFVISLLAIVPLPPETRLGYSYKLVYFHVPITVVTVSSVLLLPAFHHRLEPSLVKGLSVASTIYASMHIMLSVLFMQLAWGGVVLSEPKFIFSLVLLSFVLVHTLLCFLDPKFARAYSLLSWVILPYFYISSLSVKFQLHPEMVVMPSFFYVPYVFTFPLLTLLYIDLARWVGKTFIS